MPAFDLKGSLTVFEILNVRAISGENVSVELNDTVRGVVDRAKAATPAAWIDAIGQLRSRLKAQLLALETTELAIPNKTINAAQHQFYQAAVDLLEAELAIVK